MMRRTQKNQLMAKVGKGNNNKVHRNNLNSSNEDSSDDEDSWSSEFYHILYNMSTNLYIEN
jgi:hypothetical protein